MEWKELEYSYKSRDRFYTSIVTETFSLTAMEKGFSCKKPDMISSQMTHSWHLKVWYEGWRTLWIASIYYHRNNVFQQNLHSHFKIFKALSYQGIPLHRMHLNLLG